MPPVLWAQPTGKIFRLPPIKTDMKKILISLFVIYTLFIVFLLVKIIRTDTTDRLPRRSEYSASSASLCDLPELKAINPDSLMERFPYAKYLDSGNFKNIASIRKDLSCLDGLFKDSSLNRQTLSQALTVNLGTRYRTAFTGFQPDSLLRVIQWAEKFEAYAEIDPANDIFYGSVYNYWMQEVSNSLSAYTTQHSQAKFDFDFKYLWTRCSEQRFSPRTKTPNPEKVFTNIIYNKWGHFMNASWNQTSPTQKFTVFLVLIFTALGFIRTVTLLIKYIKNYIKHE
jgi:hypothetical protein